MKLKHTHACKRDKTAPFSHDAPWCLLRTPCVKEGDDCVWSLISCGHFLSCSSLCTIHCKKGHFDHHPGWATQPKAPVCWFLLCKHPCPYASTSSVVYKYTVLFFFWFVLFFCFCFCSFTSIAAVLVPPCAPDFFFVPLHFFFLYLAPLSFIKSVSFFHSLVPSCEQQRSEPHTL